LIGGGGGGAILISIVNNINNKGYILIKDIVGKK
jgi:hypothetical protein